MALTLAEHAAVQQPDLAADAATRARAVFLAAGADPWTRRAEKVLRDLGRPVATRRTRRDADSGVTAREIEVLSLVADGLGNRAIAARLHLSEVTVAKHLANINRKLGAKKRTEAVRIARDRGLLNEAL